jgi:hypothetical protein
VGLALAGEAPELVLETNARVGVGLGSRKFLRARPQRLPGLLVAAHPLLQLGEQLGALRLAVERAQGGLGAL